MIPSVDYSDKQLVDYSDKQLVDYCDTQLVDYSDTGHVHVVICVYYYFYQATVAAI